MTFVGGSDQYVASLTLRSGVKADYWPLLRRPGCEQGRIAAAVRDGNLLSIELLADSTKPLRCYRIQFTDPSGIPHLNRGDQVAFIANGSLITEFAVVNRTEIPLPDASDWLSPTQRDERYRFREVDFLLNEQARRLLAVRNGIVFGLRNALQKEGFIEVELPILKRHADIAPAAHFEVNNAVDRQPLYLRTTFPPFERLLLSVDQAYTIGPNFRNGDWSAKNLPEFSMLCAAKKSVPYIELHHLLRGIVADVMESVIGTPVLHFRGNTVNLRYWQEISLDQIFVESFGVTLEELDNDHVMADFATAHKVEVPIIGTSVRQGHLFRAALFDRIFESLIIPMHNDPTFYTDVPWYLAGPAEPHPSKRGLKRRGEGYVAGMELTNAKNILIDYKALTQWHESVASEKAAAGFGAYASVDRAYLQSVSYGLQPGACTSMGLDRLIMLALGVDDIRDAVLYPAF